jgi:hypothetical protein
MMAASTGLQAGSFSAAQLNPHRLTKRELERLKANGVDINQLTTQPNITVPTSQANAAPAANVMLSLAEARAQSALQQQQQQQMNARGMTMMQHAYNNLSDGKCSRHP